MPGFQQTNAPELTVSELSASLKRTIEDRFGFVRVRGEISNYRGPHSSGHAYFSLKDEFARIDAVIWKGVFARLKTKPQEGLEVLATGKITTYPGKSAYQIIIEALEPAGIGALLALVEERRRKLAAEGLFDEERKRPLPFLPSRIGVVTSPTGAVIRDILHRIAERFPRHVTVWPVRVQGESAASEIAAAIDGFNALPREGELQRPDVIIVARGGGSLEDLWAFNEENVVRAAARSEVPLIAAVGHETDWTLIDLAADLRAPTPTAAAEKAVPVRSELASLVTAIGRRQYAALLRSFGQKRGELRGLVRAFPQRESLFALRRQQIDTLESRFLAAGAVIYGQRHLAVSRLSHRLSSQSPQARLARAAERLRALEQRLLRWRVTQNAGRSQGLSFAAARLERARSLRLHAAREHAAALAHRLKQQSPAPRLTFAGGTLETLHKRLLRSVVRELEQKQQMLALAIGRFAAAKRVHLRREQERIAAAGQRLDSLARRMRRAAQSALALCRTRVAALEQLLESLSYRKVLARGFALIRDSSGKPLRRAAEAAEGMRLDIEFSDGHVPAIAGKGGQVSPPGRKPARRRLKRDQGSLF
jgi:exodeoxyribonuclease VII large subunit